MKHTKLDAASSAARAPTKSKPRGTTSRVMMIHGKNDTPIYYILYELTMAKRDRVESDKKAKKRSKKENTPDVTSFVAQESSSIYKPARRATTSSSSPSKIKRSIFLKKKIDVDLSLLPSSLHNTDDAVQNSLNQLLLKFSDGLGGIMLACENVRVKSDGNSEGRGWILNELPWIHYTVSCDALVFRPYIGCQVSPSFAKDGLESLQFWIFSQTLVIF
jgi:hypothetical protein